MPTHDIQTSNHIHSDYRPPKSLQKLLKTRETSGKTCFPSSAGIEGTRIFQLARKLVYYVKSSQSDFLNLRKR